MNRNYEHGNWQWLLGEKANAVCTRKVGDLSEVHTY